MTDERDEGFDEFAIAWKALRARHAPFDDEAKPNGSNPEREIERRSAPGNERQRFPFTAFDAITMSSKSSYLIKGILPAEGLCVVWGPPKCGKSFWTFDLTMHIALGWPYRGRRVKQGAVVYLALEGGHGFRARVEAWRRHHLADHHTPVPFQLCDVPIDLVADHKGLIAAIKTQLGDAKPAVVVIDTLNRSLIGDENASADMAKYIRAADTIRASFACLVLVIHHCGVAASRPRGHTSLTGADDAQIAIERNDSGTITAKIEHMKDGDASAPLACRLERVELGLDEDGDPITSCIIMPVEGGAAAGGKRPKLPASARLALEQLQELIAEVGEPVVASNHVPENVRACPAALWREIFYKAHPGKPDTAQKAFVRAALKLQELHLIGLWSDKVWLPDKPDIGRTNAKCPAND